MDVTPYTLPNQENGNPLAAMMADKHEKVVYHYDENTGLKAIVAIHNSVLGPVLGGLRMWNYASEGDALTDVLRLAKGMTYKSSLAGLDLGGGKAVVIGDANQLKNEAYLRKYGRFVESLQGSYITAPDVNTTVDDMVQIAKETRYVVGLPLLHGGSGDPSPMTVYGTYMALKAVAKQLYGSDSLKGKKVGVQGLGKVGANLVSFLAKEGAYIYVTDILLDKLQAVDKAYKVHVVEEAAAFYNLDMDIYAPCGLGAVLNDQTIPSLKCAAIAGAANNQLADETKHGRMLLEKGIVYAPDFAVNAGGVINVHTEFYSTYNPTLAQQQVEKIYTTCLTILKESAKTGLPTQEVATLLAQERIKAMQHAKLFKPSNPWQQLNRIH